MGRDDFHVLYGFTAREYPYEEIIASAVEKCRQVGAGILIVDTFIYWARVQDENNSAEMQKALRSLRDAASSGLTVLLIHHDRKGGGNTIESGRGSSAFAGIVDVIHNLRRPQGHGSKTVRELRSEGRYGGLYDSLMIELTEDGYLAHGTRSDVSQQKAEEAVMRTLPVSEDDALTMAHLLEALKPDGVGRSACQRVIDKMQPLGRIRKIGTGKRGDGYRYFLPLDEQIYGNGQAEAESTEGPEMLSAQHSISTGQKENGVNGQGFIWEKDEGVPE